MRIQQPVNSSETRLAYAYKARTVTLDDNQIMEANAVIADIEQAKLIKPASKLVFFCKISKWVDIEKEIRQLFPLPKSHKNRDEFFNTANLYLKNIAVSS